MKYQVEITETLSRIIDIDASSSQEAKEKVDKMYRKSIVVLDENDYGGNEIKVI